MLKLFNSEIGFMLSTFLTQWEPAATLWKRNWPSWPLTHPKSVESAIRPLVLRKAWSSCPGHVWFPCPFLAKMDASPKEAWKTYFLMDWQTELCRFSVCENYDSPKIHQWWTPLDPHFCQLRFRITSLSWFSSSEKTAASKLMINGDCKSLPNLWSQNIPFEAYKWSISDLNVIYGFIRDLCGYHDVISDFLMDLLQHNIPQWIPLPKLPLKNLLDQVSSVPRWPKWWPPQPVLSVAMVSYDVYVQLQSS